MKLRVSKATGLDLYGCQILMCNLGGDEVKVAMKFRLSCC